MELVIISLFGLAIAAAMIILVARQTQHLNRYWHERTALADQMMERNRAFLEAHGVRVG